MSNGPFVPQERWLNQDEFSVRREVIPKTTARGSLAQSKFLPSVFEDAHPWPLQWGGPEIREGRFYAHDKFNTSAMRRVENAGVRLAKIANEQGAQIRATVAVTRYKERNLLERATYKFEAVAKIGNEYQIKPLGEITIVQSLSPEQRSALANGTLISSPNAKVLEYMLDYRLDKQVIKIDPQKMIVIPAEDVFASLDDKLRDFIHGLKRPTTEKKSPRGQQIKESERKAIAQAEKEAAARATPPPVEPQYLTDNKGTDNRAVAGGRPTETERASIDTRSMKGATSSGGSMTKGRVTVTYDVHATDPKRALNVKPIDLSDFPPGGALLSGLVKHGPKLQQVTATAALASTIALLIAEASGDETKKNVQKVIEPIQSHFRSVVADAREEFLMAYPDPAALAQRAGIAQHRKDYENAWSKLRVPEGTKALGAVALALTPDKDQDATWKERAKNLDKFGVPREDMNRFRDAATAYEKVMLDFQQEVMRYLLPLPAMAEDVQRRASVLGRIGRDIEESYWSLIRSHIGSVPLIYYELLGLYRTSQVFLGMAGHVVAFAGYIDSRMRGYQALWDTLDEQLTQVYGHLNNPASAIRQGVRR